MAEDAEACRTEVRSTGSSERIVDMKLHVGSLFIAVAQGFLGASSWFGVDELLCGTIDLALLIVC